MRFFKFGKKDKILDLSKYKRKESENSEEGEGNEDISEGLVIELEKTQNPEEKRKRFTKRISDMTKTIEDLSNQIYHLQQRIELLERKLNIKVE